MCASSSSDDFAPYSDGELRELGALEQRAWIETEAARLFVEEPPPEVDAARPLLGLQDVLDLAARSRVDDERQPVAARLVARLRDDLDDVAVLRLVRSGTMRPLMRAPTHWLPTSVWTM